VVSIDKKEVILKDGSIINGQRTVIGHKKKAIFFVDGHGTRHAFPDFYTFSKLGFNVEEVRKMDDERVDAMPLGNHEIITVHTKVCFYQLLCRNTLLNYRLSISSRTG